jgi:hypothetical protein
MADRLEIFGALDATFRDLKLNRFVAERVGLQRWAVAFERLVETSEGPRLVDVVGTGTTIREAIAEALAQKAPGLAS